MTAPLPIDLMIESAGGGAMRHVMDLHDALAARGHDLRLFIALHRAEAGVMDWLTGLAPTRVITLPTARAPHPRDLRLIRHLRATLFTDGRPRLLHAHSTKAGILAACLGGRTAGRVLTPHAYRAMDPCLPWMKRQLIARAERAFSRRMDHIIAVSPEEARYARALGLPAARISHVPNGIDLAAISARAGPPRRGQAGLTLGFAGRMTAQKAPFLFLDTLQILRRSVPDLSGLMIGEGDLLPALRAHIAAQDLGRHVTLTGGLDFCRNMHRMDLLLHSSRYESLPYILLEAGAGGLPVMAVRNAGSEAIFGSDIAGIPLSAPDPAALAAVTLPLLQSPALRDLARIEGQCAAARFSIAAMADRTEAIYRRIGGFP